MGEKLLIFFIAVLLIGIISLSICNAEEAASSGAVPTSATSTDSSSTGPVETASKTTEVQPQQFTVQGTSDGKPQDVSERMNLPKGTVQISSGTVTPSFKPDIRGNPTKELTGWEVSSGVDSKGKTLPPPKDSKGNSQSQITIGQDKLSNLQDGAKIKIDSKGNIQSIDAKAGKGGGEISAGGKQFSVPESSSVQLKEGDKTITVDMPQGGKIEKVPQKTKKNDGEKDLNIDYRSSQGGYIQLPDEIAKQMGFEGKKVEFKGVLSNNGDNWFVGSSRDVTIKIDGKESLNIKNIYGKLSDLNENINVYFKDGKFEGNYVSLADKTFKTGSSNNLDGHPIELLEGNPYINMQKNSHLAFQALSNSELKISDGRILMKGSGIIDNDDTSYLLDEKKQQLFYKKGSGIIGSGDLKGKAAVSGEILPFTSANSPVSKTNEKLIVGDKGEYKIVEMSKEEVGRVRSNLPPVDSRGASVVPPVSSDTGSPAEFIKPNGNPQQNAMSSTVRIKGRDPSGQLSIGTGTIIGIKDGRAYIITAGHVVANSPNSPFQVELFDPSANQVKTVTGQVINLRYNGNPDPKRGIQDLALISVPASEGMSVAKVAPEGYNPKVGESTFGIGCTYGQNPTCRSGGVILINSITGDNNLQARTPEDAQQPFKSPQEGRSGGGLFRSDGRLIAVLSARDPNTASGLYTGTSAIQDYLNRLGLGGLYKLILAMNIKNYLNLIIFVR
jgi:hypothetical protein